MTARSSTQSLDLINEINSLKKEISELKKHELKPDGQHQQQSGNPDYQSFQDMKTQMHKHTEQMNILQNALENLKSQKIKSNEESPERFAGIDSYVPETANKPTQIMPTFQRGQRQQRQPFPQKQGEGKPNRPRPLPYEKRQELIKNKPNTLKDTFAAESVEETAFLNWRRKRLVLIGEDRLVERCLSRINTHNIHCIPVVQQSGKGIIGTIDILDIISQLINSLDKTQGTIQQQIRRDFMNKRVNELLSHKTYVISSEASLLTALQYMYQLEQDRFLVVDRPVEGTVAQLTQVEMDVDGIFTLSDVLRFLVGNSMLMKYEQIFRQSCQELGLGKRKPHTISHKTIVADAFREICRLSSMGLAVVDDNGVLVGNLSASDLKGVTRRNCPILNSTVEEFLARDQKRGWWDRPFCIDLSDSLYHTIHQFVSTGVHRAYVIDNKDFQ